MSALLEVIDLSKDFTTRSGLFRKKIHQAVKPVAFRLRRDRRLVLSVRMVQESRH